MSEVPSKRLDQLIAEQRRTNELLERIASRRPPPRKRWMCQEGREGKCYGPWYACAVFGCARPGGGG
jgi:hypothetical protein